MRWSSSALIAARLAVAALAASPWHAANATADYQLRRLIYLTTSCGLESLATLDASPGRERFKALCKNASAYPTGLEITCSDPLDDRSCKIVTAPVTFEQLELLQPKTKAVP